MSLTGRQIANSYLDLLQMNNNNAGVPAGTPITVRDGAGNATPLQLSQGTVNINGTFQYNGIALTANVSGLNAAAAGSSLVTGIVAEDGSSKYGRTLTGSTGVTITNADGTAGNPTFALVNTSVSAGSYGPANTITVDAQGRITDVTATPTVSFTNLNVVNLSATTADFSGNVSIGGSLNMSGVITPSGVSSTGDINGVNFHASGDISATALNVGGTVSAVDYYGDGSNLTGIVAASATNASYAASAGEAAVAVSAHHASSATFATSADSASFAATATNASFAASATNATNAVSAVFASSATNATTAITVNYGGVVQTSTANIGDVSASSLYVSGNVSTDGTLDVGGQVSVGGGIKVVGDVSAGNIIAGGIIYGDGAGLFNVPSAQGGTVNFVKAGTGIHVTLNGTTTTNPITASGTLALDADQSFGTVSATSFVVAGAGSLITQTSATSLVTALSTTMATSIDNTNTNLTALSATMATSINNSNTTNASAISAVSATMATSIANHLPLAGGTMTGTLTLNGAPSANLEAATKQYVDNLTAAAIHFHDPVRVEKEGNLNATYNNGTAGVGATLTNAGTQAALVIDGVTLNTSDRVLVYEQTDQTQNGIYTVTNTGSASTNWVLTRATDADSYEPNDNDGLDGGSYFYVQEGDAGAGEAYVCNNIGTITFGTTNITFVQFSSSLVYTAGSGIDISSSRVISTSGVPTNADLTALSATMATSIDNSNTLIAATSAALATSISNTNTNVTTNINAITSINSILGDGTNFATDAELAAVSSTLATSINNSNTNITTNTNAITSINSKIASVSSTLATSIGNSNTNITTNANAITSINSKIATVSSTLATSINTVNTRVTNISATFATSIANQNQTITAGSGLTGGGSGNVTLNVGAGTGITVNANDIAIGQAVGTGNSPTFAGMTLNGTLTLGSNVINDVEDIYLRDAIYHDGDTDTYLQFHSGNQFRVVTGGTEMLEVNDSYVLLGSNTVGKVHTDTSQSGTQTPNFYVYNSFVWTLTGNLTLGNPSTEVTGMSGVFIFIQDGTGGRTISLSSDYETAGAAGLTLSTAANSVDIVPYFVQSSGNILLGAPQLAFS